MEAKRNIGVLVMRMQTPRPTAGHRQLLDAVLAASDKAVIILGESPVRLDPKNPMPAKLRKRLLQEQVPHFDVLSLNDIGSNRQWSKNLDALIEKFYPTVGNNITLYGSRDSFIPFYQGPNRTKLISFETHTDVTATAARQVIYEGQFPYHHPKQARLAPAHYSRSQEQIYENVTRKQGARQKRDP